ncbi:MAG: hypothetical protein ACLPWS_07685 [Rhodomicrobium sp.]
MSAPLRYSVDIHDFGGPCRSWSRHGLTLSQAWRLVRRQARRGFRLHGGAIAYANWGARGGVFPARYRSAVITVEYMVARNERPKTVT